MSHSEASAARTPRLLREPRTDPVARQASDWPRDAETPAFLVGPPKPAAVLVPLARVDDEWHVVYIRRAANDRDHHSGQVAFPGGRLEAGDRTPERAALREAQEEIGLDPSRVRVLGRLPPYLTITNYRVTPVVGRVQWPFPVRLQASEVSRLFSIPLRWLADESHYELRPRRPAITGKPAHIVYFQRYDGELLWGATARMTLTLLASLWWED